MASFILKVIAGGRVTLPKKVRKTQGIEEGDFVEVKFIQKIRKGA